VIQTPVGFFLRSRECTMRRLLERAHNLPYEIPSNVTCTMRKESGRPQRGKEGQRNSSLCAKKKEGIGSAWKNRVACTADLCHP
jgi:hypothetical protein